MDQEVRSASDKSGDGASGWYIANIGGRIASAVRRITPGPKTPRLGKRNKTGIAVLSGALVLGPSVAFTPTISVSADSGLQSSKAAGLAPFPAPSIVVAQAPGIIAGETLRKASTRVVAVKPGDTLMNMVLKVGVPRNDAYKAISALGKVFDVRKLRPGHELTVAYIPKQTKDDKIELRGLKLRMNNYQDYRVERGESAGFTAEEHKKALTVDLMRRRGVIDSSLFVSGKQAGLTPSLMFELIRLYSWDVDFQREIQKGDRFEVVFEQYNTVDGEFVRDGNILYAKLVLSGTELPLYRYEYKPGQFDFFDDKGNGARKPLMKTPIDGARLSSRFGRRRHPILGYTRMHRGVDFAAPSGTPIYAAGDGTIVYRGRKGGYGKHIRIRHNSQYSTSYSHMRGYKSGQKKGARVKQGQVIGYVGSTGRSTGPHLHYEIIEFGRQANPLRIKLRAGRKLKGEALKTFSRMRPQIDQQVADLPAPTKIAEAE